jgi:hypothetical protein
MARNRKEERLEGAAPILVSTAHQDLILGQIPYGLVTVRLSKYTEMGVSS